jgi:cold shock CspA family protein
MDGIVEHFNHARAFGLIKPLVGRPNDAGLVFFHITSIVGHNGGACGIPAGAEVSFDLCRGAKSGRPQAANVRLKTLSSKVLLKSDTMKVALLPASVEQTAMESVALPSRPHRPPAHQSIEPKERIA